MAFVEKTLLNVNNIQFKNVKIMQERYDICQNHDMDIQSS